MKDLAVFGGTPVRTMPYPSWPVFDERDEEAVVQTVRTGRWGGSPFPGPNTAEFALRFAEMHGEGIAVPMMNGTITMEVALRAADIGWGDEVIVPAYTFQATAYAPMVVGAMPYRLLWIFRLTPTVLIHARLKLPSQREQKPSSWCISLLI